MIRTCKTCRFFHPTHATQGFCRRFPPATFPIGQDDKGNIMMQSQFPGMQFEGWCGEYAQKIELPQ